MITFILNTQRVEKQDWLFMFGRFPLDFTPWDSRSIYSVANVWRIVHYATRIVSLWISLCGYRINCTATVLLYSCMWVKRHGNSIDLSHARCFSKYGAWWSEDVKERGEIGRIT